MQWVLCGNCVTSKQKGSDVLSVSCRGVSVRINSGGLEGPAPGRERGSMRSFADTELVTGKG